MNNATYVLCVINKHRQKMQITPNKGMGMCHHGEITQTGIVFLREIIRLTFLREHGLTSGKCDEDTEVEKKAVCRQVK